MESCAFLLIRAVIPRDYFKLLINFIRFHIENTRAERAQVAEAAPHDIWIMF